MLLIVVSNDVNVLYIIDKYICIIDKYIYIIDKYICILKKKWLFKKLGY